LGKKEGVENESVPRIHIYRGKEKEGRKKSVLTSGQATRLEEEWVRPSDRKRREGKE